MKKFIGTAVLILAAVSFGKAETFSVSLFQNSTDNLFQNSAAEGDWISSLDFSADKSFSNLSLFTQGNLSYFNRNSEFTYYTHSLGLDYVLPLGGGTAAYFAATGRGAFYREDYRDFNFISLNMAAALKSYLSQTSILKAQYQMEYKNYGSELFDYLGHSLDLSLDKYFQTRTTVQLLAGWGFKSFLHPYADGSSTEASSLVIGRGGGSGYGLIKGGKSSGSSGPTAAEDNLTQSLQFLSLGGNVAQGIGSHVGIQINGFKQWSLSGRNPFSSVNDFYWIENPTYDRFAWAGHGAGAMLTVMMPWNMQAKVRYDWMWKEFPGIESYDLQGEAMGEIRQDRRNQVEARLQKDFTRFSCFLAFSYIDNHSNDPLFDWSGNFISAGIEWKFFFGDF